MLIKTKHMEKRGFSLVEILVVMALLGLVTMATMSLYLDTQRNTNTSEEVVDVQQNIRIALDQMLRDIRFSGLLIPSDQPPIAAAPQFSIDLNEDGDCTDSAIGEGPLGGSDCFAIQTVSTTGQIVRILQYPGDSPLLPNAFYDVVVASPDMIDLFNLDDYVRIIRPIDGSYPQDRVLQVKEKDRATSLLRLVGSTAITAFQVGDVIVRVIDKDVDEDGDPNSDPPVKVQRVSYRLLDNPGSDDPAMRLLVRAFSGDDVVLASNITNLQFSYLMDDGSEMATVEADRLDNILGVRVTITGATDVTRTGNPVVSGVKTRALEGVAKIRNLRVQD